MSEEKDLKVRIDASPTKSRRLQEIIAEDLERVIPHMTDLFLQRAKERIFKEQLRRGGIF